jgi:hypothetical protein
MISKKEIQKGQKEMLTVGTRFGSKSGSGTGAGKSRRWLKRAG